jgi:nicotinate dehydrogenase subunit B
LGEALQLGQHPVGSEQDVLRMLQRLDQPSTGAGEVMGATAAAIANAVFDATDARVLQYPMIPARVKAAIASKAIAAPP